MSLSQKSFFILYRCFSACVLVVCLGLQFKAQASQGEGPVCVRAKETTAHNLVLKSARKRKTFVESPVKFVKYTPLRKTGNREGRWAEVQTSRGKKFWVRNRDLSTKFQCLIVRVQKTRLYKGPGNNFEPSQMAEKGSVFLDKGGEDGWLQVESSDGVKAWINMDHVWKPTSTMRMSFENE